MAIPPNDSPRQGLSFALSSWTVAAKLRPLCTKSLDPQTDPNRTLLADLTSNYPWSLLLELLEPEDLLIMGVRLVCSS
jgi:hypothetical protein